MNKPLEEWDMLDLQQFFNEHDIEIREAVVLIGAGACEMHARALIEGMIDLADHHRKIMIDCMDHALKTLF